MQSCIRASLLIAIGCIAVAGCQPSLTPRAMEAWAENLPGGHHANSAGPVEPAAPHPDEAPPPPPGAPLLPFSTVNSPELPKRLISLVECVALALENGRTGEFFDPAGSVSRTSVRGLAQQANAAAASDSIRVFAYDPAILGTTVAQAEARFDPFSESNVFWDRIDQPTRFLTPETPFEQLTTRDKADSVLFDTGLYKPLETGGIAGIRWRNDYENNFLPPGSGILNPAYRTALEFTFEQPLLQGAGVFINQVRDTLPEGLRRTLPDVGRPPGILLTRIGVTQSQLEFERQVQNLIFRVEEAYWQLYCAYWDLYASENALKQAEQELTIARKRYENKFIADDELAMVEEQYHFFRNQRLQALGNGQPGHPGVLEAERQLRYVVGLPPEDGSRLVPADPLTLVVYQPDPVASVADAEMHRPELRQVEEEIQAAHLAIARAQDRLKPDLRFVSRYDINGLAGNFGGTFHDIADQPHQEWELGMRLQFPLGFRAGNAEMTRAKLLLAQRLAFLNDQKQKLIFSLQRSYRDLAQFRDQYEIRKSLRLAAGKQYEVRLQQYKAGGPDPKKFQGSFIDLLLRAQRNWVDALREEHIALCNYRIAIADFERQKGTICAYANVIIQDGTAPMCVATNASSYLRQRKEPDLRKDVELPEEAPSLATYAAAPAVEEARAASDAPAATLGTPDSVAGE